VSQDDVLFGYRVQLFDLAGRVGVAAACRTFGVHRSTYYAWKRQVDRHGLEMLRPRERRRPRMPNQLSAIIEERIVAFALAYPGLGPRRIASELARPRWGGIVVSANGSGAACAGTASTPAASGCRSSPATGRRTSRRAILGRKRASRSSGPASWLASTASTSAGYAETTGAIWQLTAIDCCSS
jgi:hypothetical protein